MQHKQKLVDKVTQINDKSHAGTWKDVTAVDIEVFLVLKHLTGIIKKPIIKRIKSHWSKNSLLQGPAYTLAMSRYMRHTCISPLRR